ncbi:hypothetical protein BACERE00185_00264 [Bacillus mobilis]|uniref:Uncharacterized protein n=1 Tax=Bacillus mobilis TaxID=2026190 RepID=A0A1Y5YXJ7_9BACI|nr:hypothetical protein [Bacillus mobilis]SMD67862.1 hypothetical protein BACERE00185_00264 [Bacillus mobilis]
MKLTDIKEDKSLWEKMNIEGVGKVLLVEESYYDGIVGLVEKAQEKINNFESVELEKCYSCEGKGVGLDLGDMAFWECETCGGTGELEIENSEEN